MRWLTSLFRHDPVPNEQAVQISSVLSPPQTGAARPDNPIRNITDDSLGRAASAAVFCTHVLRLDAREGLVVGVLGPWGSGKTSFVNLARLEFERRSVYVIDFNPWMFSGTEQLIQSFFFELSAQLKLRPDLAEAGKTIEHYGELFANLSWVPVVGSWMSGVQGLAKAVSAIMKRKKGGVSRERTRVSDSLRKLGRPVCVVLDDIDRLSTSEIRDIFRLVRLTANFPNLVYVLAFDRHRVEAALSEDGFPGRAYLEKILQVCFDLPAIPELALSDEIVGALDATLADIDDRGPFDEERWSDVFAEVVRPLIANMRDVRRYAAGLEGTVREMNGRMDLVDVLALEAVRIFLPDVFCRLPALASLLTETSDYVFRTSERSDDAKRQIEEFIASADPHRQVARALINRLFMAARRHVGRSTYGGEWPARWLRERRAAHIEVLRLYLERVAGQGLIAFNAAEEAWALLPNAEAFDGFLRALPRDQAADVISHLEAYESEVPSDRVVPGVVTLLNIAPDLPDTKRGLLELGPRVTVARVVYLLLKSLSSSVAIEAAVHEIHLRLRTLHAKRWLIEIVGHTTGQALISEESAKKLATNWRSELRALSAAALAEEPDLLRSVLVANRDRTSDEPLLTIPDDPRVSYALLSSSKGESRSQAVGSSAVKRSPRLAWNELVEICGGEEALRTRIQGIRAASITDVADVLELADRYLSGWRHKDFGSD